MIMEAAPLLSLLLTCSPHVDATTAMSLIQVESGRNPHAIGVVGGQLTRQPRTRSEALATARALEQGGWNYSIGLAQINRHNLPRLGLTLESAFDPCRNLAAMQTVLGECYARARRGPTADNQAALRRALSCYYSGNFATGIRQGYVRKVVQAAARAT